MEKLTFEKAGGWLTKNEQDCLCKLAKSCTGKGVIVEIGSWKGKSTICLAKGSQLGRRVPIYAIDPHTGAPEHHAIFSTTEIWTFDEFKKNIKEAGVEDLVNSIVDRSENVAKNWDKPIEFLWIDGAHAYESALLDFKSWYPHLIDGGIIAYHDNIGEVKAVVKEKIWLSGHFKNCGLVDLIAFGTKSVLSISRWQRIRNRWILFLSDTIDFFRNLPLPRFIRNPMKTFSKIIFNSRRINKN